MRTDEMLNQVLGMAEELDRLAERLGERAHRADRQVQDLTEALEEEKEQLRSQEKQDTEEEQNKAQELIGKQEKLLQDIGVMYERLITLYGQKYGKPNKKVTARKMNIDNLKTVFQKVTDPSVLAVFKRLFGLDGYKARKEMYEDFLFVSECYRKYLEGEKLKLEEERDFQVSLIHDRFMSKKEEALAENNAKTEEIWRACVSEQQMWISEKQADIIEGKLAEYDRQVEEGISAFPIQERAWQKYTEINEPQEELYLGDILVPWMQEEEMDVMFRMGLKNAAPHASEDDSVIVPYTECITGGMRLLVEYDVSDPRIGKWIQSLLFQVIHGMPLYHYQMLFLDAEQNGKDLGDMTMLNSVIDTEAEDIHPGLKCDTYRILKLCQDKEEIRSCIRELAEFMKKVSVLLGKTDSVEEFNRNNKKIIPYQMIVFQNFPSGLEDETLEKLNSMIRQGKRFGFSFIILGGDGIAEDFPELTETFTGIRISQDGAVIQIGNYYLPIRLKGFPEDSVKNRYLSSLRKLFLCSFQDIDNRFGSFMQYEEALPVRDSTDKMMIPFAINRRGRLMELELGSSLTAHGLLSGGTGSGKTTLLHAIIHSVMLNYRPEDVQLWLVDYKMAEFAVYAQNTPAHIRLVGVQNSQEFTFAFLDYVTAEYERRMELFKQATKEKGVAVNSMREYRKHYGKDSMPRILIIVDEFHKMTQHIQDNEYKEVLENQLAEVRASGITYLFSDQTVSVGLRGLTEKGRRQIMVRMAMKQGGNDPETEIVETIGIDRERAKQMNDMMDIGHVLFQQQVPVMEASGRETAKTMLLHCRALWLDGETQKKIALRLIDTYGSQPDLICVDGREAKVRKEEVIRQYLDREADSASGIPIVLGTPANLEPCMVFRINRNYNQNIICVGEKTELRLRILIHTVYSLLAQGEREIYLLAEENDILFRGAERRRLSALKEHGVQILTDYGDICRLIDEMKSKILRRQRGRGGSNENIFLFWIGLDNMLSFFQTLKKTEYYSEAREKKDTAPVDIAGLAGLFDSMFPGAREPGVIDRQEPEEDALEELYNTCDDVNTIISHGPRNGVFNYVTYSAVTPLNTYKRIVHVERFLHRIALKMDETSSADFLNNKARMASSELSADRAVYYDGGRIGRYFIPYL